MIYNGWPEVFVPLPTVTFYYHDGSYKRHNVSFIFLLITIIYKNYLLITFCTLTLLTELSNTFIYSIITNGIFYESLTRSMINQHIRQTLDDIAANRFVIEPTKLRAPMFLKQLAFCFLCGCIIEGLIVVRHIVWR